MQFYDTYYMDLKVNLAKPKKKKESKEQTC